ncbi:MAG: hypothetical protein JNJ80_24365 [Gemmatimonadetes bacterium]|nr:hypothetical protein [Gemmatimonadota bacterium]
MQLARGWYERITTDSLRQGDIFPVLQVPVIDHWEYPDGDETKLPKVFADLMKARWIVLTASCDVDLGGRSKPACEQVLIAPIFEANDKNLGASKPEELSLKRELLKEGLILSRFLLAPHPEASPPFELSYVDYRMHRMVPHKWLASQAPVAERLRLNSPIREKFGAWLAGAVFRVGPENDLLIERFLQLYDGRRIKATEQPGY